MHCKPVTILFVCLNFLPTTFLPWTFSETGKGQRRDEETSVQVWTWPLSNLYQLKVSSCREWRCWTELRLSPHSTLFLWMIGVYFWDKQLRCIAITGYAILVIFIMPWPLHLGCFLHYGYSENAGDCTIGRWLCLTHSSQELAFKEKLKVTGSPLWIANTG